MCLPFVYIYYNSMNRNFLLLLGLSLLSFSPIFAVASAGNQVIENLLQGKNPVSFVSWPRQNYLRSIDAPFDTYPQNLIKNGADLYLFINGSGRLYKVSGKDTTIQFTRIDSTTNFGYNIGSFGFSYQNRIYNLGGYGYWRMNGQLRVFNEHESEWDIVKLNKEIPILTGKTEGLLWYDMAGNKLYTAYYLNRNEAIKTKELDETRFVFDVMVLDLQKNEWSQLGELSTFLSTKLQIIKTLTMSPWGLIITIGDKISLLDFKSNQILSLDTRKEQYQSLIRAGWDRSFYCKDSTLFYGIDTKLDSIPLHYSDFLFNNERLFSGTVIASLTTKSTVYSLLFVFLTILGFSAFKFRKQSSLKQAVTSTTGKGKNPGSMQNVFDEMETQLLQLLIQNTASGTTTSTDEQNRILGLGKKSPEIQKKQRSDIIIAINRKFAFVTNSKDPIIQKKRSDQDKRSFEYFIDYARLDEIRSFLQTNTG